MNEISNLWRKILSEGEIKSDRTGTGTKSIFGGQLSFDLRERFPLLTIKKTLWKSAFIEMLWFLRGEDNTSFLKQHNVPIWDDWADEKGNLGPIYGVQWRKWKKYNVKNTTDSIEHLDGGTTYFNATVTITETDQIKELIHKLKTKPNDRRLIVSAWNVADVPDMGLPPCHHAHQAYVTNNKELDLMVHIRSSDTVLGLPFNVAQYALLLHLYARAANLSPRYLKITLGDAHIYANHIEKLEEILSTSNDINCKTKLIFNTDNIEIDNYKIEDFSIDNYECNKFVKFPIAV